MKDVPCPTCGVTMRQDYMRLAYWCDNEECPTEWYASRALLERLCGLEHPHDANILCRGQESA